jgi:hypothetical protein
MPLAVALNAPLLHGFSPVRRSQRAGLPLVLLRFSPRHKSPTPDTARRAAPLVVFVDEYLSASGIPGRGFASLNSTQETSA